MKKLFLLLTAIIFLTGLQVRADYFENLPHRITQPDGNVIYCYVSGDEYFNWLHDADGYTIVQADDGFYYYGKSENGRVVPTGHRVLSNSDPNTLGLRKWAKISRDEYLKRKEEMEVESSRSIRAPHLGTMNNLVVYIKFSDDTEFTGARQTYDDLFNLPTGNSLKSYYNEVSYNQFTISSTHYPECAMTTNLSYTDSHPRNYFEPYNATTNPNGYNGETERRLREHALLRDAINWINANSPVPSSLNIDGDNDGEVDNVCFIIKGGNGAWASLLWAHRWALYTYNVFINGKRVWDYTFQPESQVNVKTLCHEMFHALGAPDLYHYDDGGLNIAPVGNWDLMESGGGHMGAYMKWKYSNNAWINSIPEITSSGTYTLNPLSEADNNCYKIASPYSNYEFFLVEYRRKTGTFESSLPGSGLLVYRINSMLNGNADGPPDEVYIYRPNGTVTTNGSPNIAHFSQGSGRTAINDATNPSSFLHDGSPGGLNIYNVTEAGNTISFSVTINSISIENPELFTAVATGETQIDLTWTKNSANDNVMLVFNTSPQIGNPVLGNTYAVGSNLPGGGTVLYAGGNEAFSHTNLALGTTYYYKIWSVDAGNLYSSGVTASAQTICASSGLPYSNSFSTQEFPHCWSQQATGTNVQNAWIVSASNYAGGTSPYEMMATYQNVNPGVTRLVMCPLNTINMSELSLSFRQTLDGWAPGTTARIQSSTDGINWTNEAWSLATTGNVTVGPQLVNTTIVNSLNSPNTYIAFVLEGNLYNFDYWYIDDVSVSVNTILTYEISATPVPAAGGSVSGAGMYGPGSTAVLTATPAAGYNFLYWKEGGVQVSSDPVYSFTVTGNRALEAHFEEQVMISLEILSVPPEGGTTTGEGSYPQGSLVTVTATPAEGWAFSMWMMNGMPASTSPVWSFYLYINRTIVAQFKEVLPEYELTLDASPAEGGSVTGAGTYPEGTAVTVQATPNAGWSFLYWDEGGMQVSADPEYSFEISSDRSLTAYFAEEFQISASANPASAGTVTGTGIYTAGQQAVLTATASTGFEFMNWTEGGAVVSTGAVYEFTVTGDRTLVANFSEVLPEYTVSTAPSPAAGGTTSGSGTYAAGSQVVVSAVPAAGWSFNSWTENGSYVSDNPEYTFVISFNRNLTAVFVKNYLITAVASPEAGGRVEGAGVYPEGEQAVLKAIPGVGYHFTGWKENGNVVSVNPEYTFTVIGDRSLTAVFELSVGTDLIAAEPIKIYPNPSAGMVNVVSAGNIESLSVYSVTGRELLSVSDAATNQLRIDLAGNPEGIYFIKIKVENRPLYTTKIVIRR